MDSKPGTKILRVGEWCPRDLLIPPELCLLNGCLGFFHSYAYNFSWFLSLFSISINSSFHIFVTLQLIQGELLMFVLHLANSLYCYLGFFISSNGDVNSVTLETFTCINSFHFLHIFISTGSYGFPFLLSRVQTLSYHAKNAEQLLKCYFGFFSQRYASPLNLWMMLFFSFLL